MALKFRHGFNHPQRYGERLRAGIAKLNSEILKNLKLPDVLERIGALGFEAVGSTPQEFGAFIRSELAKWAKVAKDSGAKVE